MFKGRLGAGFLFAPVDSVFEAPDHCENTKEDGEIKRYLRVTKANGDPDFEKRLVQEINKSILNRPDYRFPYQVCWDIVEDIWARAHKGKITK